MGMGPTNGDESPLLAPTDSKRVIRDFRGSASRSEKLGIGAAAMLVGALAGERPVSGTCPVATVVISGGGAGDQSVGSPDVNVLVGWGDPVSSNGRASKSAGRSESET